MAIKQGIIQYYNNPALCIGAVDQMAGSKVQLTSTTSAPNLILWQWDTIQGTFTLVSSIGAPGSQLVLTIPGSTCTGNPVLTVNAPQPNFPYQVWSHLMDPGVIASVSCSGNVVDAQSRQVTAGTSIWLYANNGSPAQFFTFVEVNSNLMLADTLETAEA